MIRHRHPATTAPALLARRQLLALLIVLALACGVLLYGLGYVLLSSLAAKPASAMASSIESPGSDPSRRREVIAAAPMTLVADDAATTPGVAISLPAPITLPLPGSVDANGVPSGFPHSPLGAAAQLAAIDVRVLSAMSLPLAMDVYGSWALPGGAGATTWSQTRNVQSFLTHARQSSNFLDPGTLVSVTPAAIQIKGTDGPDWVVACVLLDVRAALKNEARMGFGTCERMQWTNGRWLIGPGTPPSLAPSTWPGSDASVKAGWQPLTPA